MKKFFTIFTILAAIILTSSCQKELPDAVKNIDVSQGEKTPNPTPTTASELKVSEPGQFGAKGGEQTMTVTATAAWTISKSAGSDWLTIKPESGNAGTSQVTLTAAENTTTGSRTSTITVKSGELTKSISVSQSAANPEMSLGTSSLDFAAGSGSKMFRISSNTMWAVSSDKNWCCVSPTSGSNDGSVTISVEENTSTSERTATITVESATITRTLSVVQSGATPVTPPASQDRTFTVGGVTFKMIYVEGGTFTMGATSEQGSDAYDREKPAHSVTLSSYCIGETEVTQALWQAVMGQKPTSDGPQWSNIYGLGSNYPAYYVSWYDCQDFIQRLNSLTGENFRLPTEAEWEFAARGGNKSRGYKYAGSNTIDNVAWYYENSYAKGEGSSDYGTHNVATKQANELELYDMSGNVEEWCSDNYGIYSSSSQTNPIGPSATGGNVVDRCVFRGGSWSDYARSCRVSFRYYYYPMDDGYNDYNPPIIIYLGLRLAL